MTRLLMALATGIILTILSLYMLLQYAMIEVTILIRYTPALSKWWMITIGK